MGRRGMLVAGLLILAAEAHAAADRGFGLSVIVRGSELPELRGNGAIYVEAMRNVPYALRIANPFPYRVAVALSVDGLNTIDAKHTDSWGARKWVLEPYETATIPGWQVSGSDAREFFFTGERNSYAARLGKAENLGVIEAAFYRERAPIPSPTYVSPPQPSPSAAPAPAAPRDGLAGGVEGGVVTPLQALAAPAPRAASETPAKSRADSLSDEYAATGIGDRRRHEVFDVSLDLERRPAATIRLRYEFRPQLVRLGLLPRNPDPLERRERSSGFSSYCPDLAP